MPVSYFSDFYEGSYDGGYFQKQPISIFLSSGQMEASTIKFSMFLEPSRKILAFFGGVTHAYQPNIKKSSHYVGSYRRLKIYN